MSSCHAHITEFTSIYGMTSPFLLVHFGTINVKPYFTCRQTLVICKCLQNFKKMSLDSYIWYDAETWSQYCKSINSEKDISFCYNETYSVAFTNQIHLFFMDKTCINWFFGTRIVANGCYLMCSLYFIGQYLVSVAQSASAFGC